jgi:Uma2 family endonuclease
MNEHLRPDRLPGTTRAAEGLPRRRWTVAELEAIAAQGVFSENERFELIGGEVVPMSPKGRRHEIVSAELAFFMSRRASADLRVKAEAQLNPTSGSGYAHKEDRTADRELIPEAAPALAAKLGDLDLG